MKFGLSQQQYQFIKDHVVKPLEEKNAQVWCYGSRARGDFKAFSDLDLMIENAPQLDSLIGSIQEGLTNSNFPFKVDLVRLEQFAESYQSKYQEEKIRF